jgi:hypothetical protein
MVAFLATFCSSNFFNFHLICSFKTRFVIGILRFQKKFDVMNVLGTQIELWCRNFGLLGLFFISLGFPEYKERKEMLFLNFIFQLSFSISTTLKI